MMNEPSKSSQAVAQRALHVLVGDGSSKPTDILPAILRHAFDHRRHVTIHTRGHIQDLVVAASRRPYDLFVLSLANLTQRGIALDPATAIDRAAELVPYLKQTYRRPIVVLAGRYSGPALHWLEQAGADVILPMPFTLDQFTDLVVSCVECAPVPALFEGTSPADP